MELPYILVLEQTLNANGQASFSHLVPNTESLEILDLAFDATGTFNIVDIRTTDGKHYTNASTLKEIPSAVLMSGGDGNNAINPFQQKLTVNKGVTFYVDVEDSSGATNTVTLVFVCRRITG